MAVTWSKLPACLVEPPPGRSSLASKLAACSTSIQIDEEVIGAIGFDQDCFARGVVFPVFRGQSRVGDLKASAAFTRGRARRERANGDFVRSRVGALIIAGVKDETAVASEA